MYVNGQTYNTNPVTVRYSVSDYLETMHKKYTENYRSTEYKA